MRQKSRPSPSTTGSCTQTWRPPAQSLACNLDGPNPRSAGTRLNLSVTCRCFGRWQEFEVEGHVSACGCWQQWLLECQTCARSADFGIRWMCRVARWRIQWRRSLICFSVGPTKLFCGLFDDSVFLMPFSFSLHNESW